MASTSVFTRFINNKSSIPELEVWYFRALFFLIAFAYFFSGIQQTETSKIFIAPNQIIALLPLAFLIMSFFIPAVKRYIQESAQFVFLLLTIHLIFFLFKNNSTGYVAFAVVAIILFSNLHISNITNLILYNVIVLGAIEFWLIAGGTALAMSPTALFFTVVVAMLGCVLLQWYRIWQNKTQAAHATALNVVFENAPVALLLFNRETLVLQDVNQQARNILSVKENTAYTLYDLFALEKYDYTEIIKLAVTNNFIQINCETYQHKNILLTLTVPASDNQLLLAAMENMPDIKTQKQQNYDAAPGNFYVTDKAGTIIYKSKDADDFISISEDALRNYFIETVAAAQDIHDYTIFKINPHDPFIFELLLKKSGDTEVIFWMLIKNNIMIDEKAPALLLPAGTWCHLQLNEENELISFAPSLLNTLGYNEDELAVLKLTQLMHPADINRYEETLVQTHVVKQAEATLRFIHKSGKIIYLKTTFSSNGTAAIDLYAEDITKSVLLQKELTIARANVSSVIENTNDIILSVDMNHEITVINAAFKNYFHTKYGQWLKPGDNYRKALPAPESEMWNDNHMEVMKGKKITYTEQMKLDADGTAIFEISLHPVSHEDAVISGVSLFGRDVTQRVKYENDLHQAKEIAETATNAKSQFLATMSHEIRTPLNGIVGMLELLKMTPLKDKQREYVSTLQLSSENMLNIINDVLDFSKIESDKMELEYEPFELRKVIEETFDLLYYRALGKKLELFYNVDETIPAFVMGDSMRLKQVLVNLVGNAIKFTDKGHILITAQLQPVMGDTLSIRFSVKDTGAGISEEQQVRLFQSFSQADASTFRKYGGTGLGLTISSKLVSLMHGRIEVSSTPGQGSEFYFTIQTKPAPVAASRDVRTNLRILRGKQLLIFTVNSDFEITMSDMFNDWNILYHTVGTLEDAKKELNPNSNYDALIMDAQMPEYLLYAEELKEQIRQSAIPVFAFNANFSGGDIIYGNKLFDAVLPAQIDTIKISTVLIKSFIENSAMQMRGDELMPAYSEELAKKYPLQILIAEDNPVNQTLAITVLEKLGYKPDAVDNGLRVLEKVKERVYDLIFMDVQMPEKDGLETTIALRNDNNKSIIIAMTAFAMDGDKDKCLAAGMDDYTTKPVRIEGVQALLEKWGEHIAEQKRQSLETIPVIDMDVIKRLEALAPEGDHSFVKNILALFEKQMERIVPELENHFKTNDLDKMYKDAHKLKGSALNIGARLLTVACKTIEEKGKNGITEGLANDVVIFKNAAKLTSENLKKLNL
jgi:signal transduction histidine kinase/DNA-binding response OmpR family regulator